MAESDAVAGSSSIDPARQGRSPRCMPTRWSCRTRTRWPRPSPRRNGLYAVRLPGVRTWTPVTFYRLADGTAYVHMSARATRKVA